MKLTPFVALLAATSTAQGAIAPPPAGFSAPDNASPLAKATLRNGNSSAPKQPVCHVESALRRTNNANWAFGFGAPLGAWLGTAAGAHAGAVINDRINRDRSHTKLFASFGAAVGAFAGVIPGAALGAGEAVAAQNACPADVLPKAANPLNCSDTKVFPTALLPLGPMLGGGSIAAAMGAVAGGRAGYLLDKRLGGRSAPRWTIIGAALSGAVLHGATSGTIAGTLFPKPEIQTSCPEDLLTPA